MSVPSQTVKCCPHWKKPDASSSGTETVTRTPLSPGRSGLSSSVYMTAGKYCCWVGRWQDGTRSMRPGTPLRYCCRDRPVVSRVTTAANLKRRQVRTAGCRTATGGTSAAARCRGTESARSAGSSGSKSCRVPYSGSLKAFEAWQLGQSTFPLTGASHGVPRCR